MSLIYSTDCMVGTQINPRAFYIQGAREVHLTSTDFDNPVTILITQKSETETLDLVHSDSNGIQLQEYVDCRVEIFIPNNTEWDLTLLKCTTVSVKGIHARDLKLDIASTSYIHVSESVLGELHLSGPRISVTNTHTCVNMYVFYTDSTTVSIQNSSTPEIGVTLGLGNVLLKDNQMNLVNMICKMASVSMMNHQANKIGITTTSGSVHIEDSFADERFSVQTVNGYLDGSGDCEIEFRTETGANSYIVKSTKRPRW